MMPPVIICIRYDILSARIAVPGTTESLASLYIQIPDVSSRKYSYDTLREVHIL